jgi:predicted ATPase
LLKKARFYEIAMQSFPSLETLRHVLELQRQSRSLLKAGSLRYLLHIRMENVFQSRVFFLKNLEFITATDAGRITYEETVRFEEIHERAYRHLEFEITIIDRGSVSDRVKEVKRTLLTHASFESLPKTGG